MRLAEMPESGVVVTGIVGAAGLVPTLSAIRAGKKVLIANKEPLVMMGSEMMREAALSGATVIPLDSEHNAVLQCLPEAFRNEQLNYSKKSSRRRLEEYGVEYLCDYTADDHPFKFNTPKKNLISVPYTVDLNDIPAFLNVGVSSEAFGDMIIDQFDVLYEEGATNARCMPICLHTFHVGQPNKFKHLKRAFEYMAKHDDVWLTTGDEMNDWYRKNYMKKK